MLTQKIVSRIICVVLALQGVALGRDWGGYGGFMGVGGNYYYRSSSFLQTHYLDSRGYWRRIPPFGLNSNSAPAEINSNYANVDMLFGTLFFSNSDYYLPGRNRMDIDIKRVYNSNVQTDGTTSSPNWPSFGTDTKFGYLGPGWNSGFDRILGDTIFYGNGGSEFLFQDIADNTRKKTKTFAVIDINDTTLADTLYRLDGTIVIYDNYLKWDEFFHGGWNKSYAGKHVTKIIDPFGNQTTFDYFSDSPLVDSITEAAGRTVWFEYSSTDTVDLSTTRLLRIIYRDHGGNADTIKYIYDDDIGPLYSDNPLRMAIFPAGDTINYLYTDSVYWEGDSTMHGCGAYRLLEVKLPFGGKYYYDWGLYSERDTTLTQQYSWHVNVRRIRCNDGIGSSVDTISFDYEYPADRSTYTRVNSSVIYPDNSLREYTHTRVLATQITDVYQFRGLLENIKYYNDAADTTSLLYEWCAGYKGNPPHYAAGYLTYAIGTFGGDSVLVPMLQYYYQARGKAPRYEYQTVIGGDFVFNPYTGTFSTVATDKDSTTSSRIYISSSNRAILDSVITMDIDTVVTKYFPNTTTMKMDSIRTSSKGESRMTKFEYDFFGNMTKKTLLFADTASILVMEYDTTSLKGCFPTKASDNYNVLWEKDYHLNTGQIKHEISANEDTMFFYYDAYDRPKKVKRPLESGYSLTTTYDRANKAIIDSLKISSALYNVTTGYSDGYGRLIKEKSIDNDLDSIVTRNEYDFRGSVTRSTRAYTAISDTAWTTYNYDALGRIIRIDYPDGTSDSTYYDADSSSTAAWTVKRIDPLGRMNTAIFNNKSQLVKVKSDTLGQDSVLFEYTAFSRLSKLTDPRGLDTKYEYNAFHTVSKDSTGDEGVRQYYYDSRDRLRFLKKAEGDWMYLKYDVIGRLTETGIADSIITDSVDIRDYPSSDRTIQVTYKYDEYEVSFPFIDSTITNPVGRLTIMDDESGKTWLYYDDRNRLALKMVQIDGLTDTLKIWFHYGNADQVEKVVYPDSTQISYEYYKSLRIRNIPGYVKESIGMGTGITKGGYKYESWGGIDKIILKDDTSFTVSYDYNSMSLPTKIFARKDTLGIWGRSYGYDNAHMITLVKELDNSGNPTNDTTRIYDYDYLYRLIEADIMPASEEIRFGFDKSGNRLFKVEDDTSGIDSTIYYYSSGSNRLLSISGQDLNNYEYNENGSVVYDSSKNIEYFFDEANHLDSVSVDGYKRYVYYYDAAGRRVKKLFIEGIFCDSTEWSIDNHNDNCEHDLPTCDYTPGDVDGIGSGCTLNDVIYLNSYYRGEGDPPPYPIFRGDVNCDSSRSINLGDVIYVIACYRGEVSPKCCYWIYTDTTATYYVYSGKQMLAEYDESGNLLDNYIYGNGLNPIAKNNPTDGKRFYMRDIRGSVVAVTDSTGSSLTSYDYYPFGGGLTVGGSHDRYRYTHKEFEDGYEVNVYYYGARYMDPALGRFISPDPIRGYYNPYSYVANDPINYYDPDGKQDIPIECFVGLGSLPCFEEQYFWDTSRPLTSYEDLERRIQWRATKLGIHQRGLEGHLDHMWDLAQQMEPGDGLTFNLELKRKAEDNLKSGTFGKLRQKVKNLGESISKILNQAAKDYMEIRFDKGPTVGGDDQLPSKWWNTAGPCDGDLDPFGDDESEDSTPESPPENQFIKQLIDKYLDMLRGFRKLFVLEPGLAFS